ncbi:hypothetical protein [Blastomonas fulva]|uniref:hypothetical protein n=1 Tax=Blastomonas fulva TaxID=1550728 RepID=UPI0025A44461|nr:hypothetical protein [Blastomonas fulva]MDM7928702.1 hypothetical protein [Blastomonas fulva]MDM7964488.1 hypothetical protein [Blastomonas fulva]
MSDRASSQFKTPIIYGAGLVALALVMLTGLRLAGQEDAAPVDGAAIQSVEAPPALAPEVIQSAKDALIAEPKVLNLAYDPSLEVQWNIAVADDGTRRDGLASYFCMVLGDNGALTDSTKVRIVDAEKASDLKDAYRDYALATVDCTSGQPVG